MAVVNNRAKAWEEARAKDLKEYVYPDSPGATQCVFCMMWFYSKSHKKGSLSEADKHMKGKC